MPSSGRRGVLRQRMWRSRFAHPAQAVVASVVGALTVGTVLSVLPAAVMDNPPMEVLPGATSPTGETLLDSDDTVIVLEPAAVAEHFIDMA